MSMQRVNMHNRLKYCSSIALVFLLLFSFTHTSYAGSQFSIFELDNKKGLINEKGEVIIPAEHEDLGWSKGLPLVIDNTIGFKREGKWGLLNTKNQKIIGAEYLDLYPFDEQSLVCSRKYFGDITRQFGLITTKGKLLLPFKYDLLEANHTRLIARTKDRNNISYALLDKNGKVYLPFQYKRIVPLNTTLYAVSEDLYEYSLYRQDGVQVSAEKYDSVAAFQHGYARVFKNGRQGLIDQHGKRVVEVDYERINVQSDGKVLVKPFSKWTLLDGQNQPRGVFYYEKVSPFDKRAFKASVGDIQALVNLSDEPLTSFKNYSFLQLSDTLVSYSLNGKQGIASVSGNEIVAPVYDSVFIDTPHLLLYSAVSDQKGWRLAGLDGSILSNENYDDIRRLNAEFFKMKKEKYWGLMNAEGREVVFCKYDSIENFFENRLKVHFFGENGILNDKGEWIILPQKQQVDLLPGNKYLRRSIYGSEVKSFDGTVDFKTDYFLYIHGNDFLEKDLDGYFGLFDKAGRRLCETIYTSISLAQEDSIFVAKKDSATSFITRGGKTLARLDPRFQQIMPMSEIFIGVKIDGKYGFVDPNGDLRIANRYEAIGPFNEGLAPVKILGKWGFVNKVEHLVIQPRYDEIPVYAEGLFIVKQDQKYGLIDTKGNIVARTEYDEIRKLESGAFLSRINDKIGLINSLGRTMILPRFDRLQDLGNGLIIATRKNKYGLLSSNGMDVIPMIYDEIVYDPINDLYLCKEESQWREYNQGE